MAKDDGARPAPVRAARGSKRNEGARPEDAGHGPAIGGTEVTGTEVTGPDAAVVRPPPDGPADGDGLPHRQRRVLEVIRDSVDRRGYPPSMREIGESVGLTSPSSVAHQLTTLERKGYLRRDPNPAPATQGVPPGGRPGASSAGPGPPPAGDPGTGPGGGAPPPPLL